MKAIIENGKINDGIQSCFISEYGVGIVFHNIDLADKFVLSLNMYGIPCVQNGNLVFRKTNKSAKIPYKIDCTSESFCQVWQ